MFIQVGVKPTGRGARFPARKRDLNRHNGFEAEDGGAAGVGLFEVEGEVEGPVVEVVWVDEGLVEGQAVLGEMGVAGVPGFGIEADLVASVVVGVEEDEQTFVGPELAVGVVGFDEAERGFRLVAGEGGDEGEDVVAEVAAECLFVLGVGDLGFEGGDFFLRI